MEKVTAALKAEGFGIITEVDLQAKLKEKLGVEFRNYRILGACNPALAHQALQVEDKVGLMMPCNLIVQDKGPGLVEVAAINPLSAMQAIGNPALTEVATRVSDLLQKVIESLS
mgnify:CR=1 FL=1